MNEFQLKGPNKGMVRMASKAMGSNSSQVMGLIQYSVSCVSSSVVSTRVPEICTLGTPFCVYMSTHNSCVAALGFMQILNIC